METMRKGIGKDGEGGWNGKAGHRRKNPKLLIGVNRIDPPNIVPQVRPFGLNPAIRFSDKIVSSSEHR